MQIVDGEVQKNREDKDTKTITLDPSRERDLVDGTVSEVESADAMESENLEQFAEQLDGYRRNKERQEAWIREIRLPREGTPEPNDFLEIEFLLPSGDTFTRSFRVPPQTWPEDNDLVQLLETVGRTPITMTKMIGDSVEIFHNGTEWRLAIDSDDTQRVHTTSQSHFSDDDERIINTIAISLLTIVAIIHLALPLVVLSGVAGMFLVPLTVGMFLFFTGIIYAMLATH